ncbi:MAG TPA: tetratricopeptide repeat protein, partial [Pyrinomonadaceae bacterium]
MYRETGKVSAQLIATSLLFSCLSLVWFKVEVRAQQQQPSPTVAEGAAARERGIKLYEQGEIKEAVKALREAVKQDKNDAAAWYYLSIALNRDDDVKGARKAAEQAVKLRPDSAPARAGLAYLLLLSNKLGDALREAESALALNARNTEANYVVSVVRLQQGEPSKALDAIQAALNSKPDFPAALLWKSQVLLSLYAEAIDSLDKIPREAGKQVVARLPKLLKGAAESLEKSLQLNPSMPEAELWREQLATLRVYVQN